MPDIERLTVEYMKAWEARMTPAQLKYAFAAARRDGWNGRSGPPMWVWAAYFREAERDA